MVDFDAEKICRVCLQTDTKVSPLFDERNAVMGVCLSDMITECTTYPVCRYDGFPDLICYDCMERVRNAYAFKKQYEKSHRKLISFLEIKLNSHEEQSAENEKCTRTDNTPLYPCEKCDEKFTNFERFREHISVVHKGTANLCRLCSKTFDSFGDLINHIGVCHPESGLSGTEHSGEFDENKWNPDGNDILEETEFVMVQEPYSDVLSASNSVERTEIDFSKNEMETSEDSDNALNLEPKIEILWNDPADGSFGGGFAGSIPSRRPEDQSPVSAQIPYQYQEDVTTVREQPDEIPNDTTLKDANRVGEDNTAPEHTQVKPHIPSQSQERPFNCHICDKRFRIAASLKTHMITHTSERPYKCHICNKSFRRPYHLNRHRSMVHKEAIVKRKRVVYSTS